MMIFQYNYEYRIKKLLKLVNLRSLNILDFGCGIGNWNEKDINSHSIKKITLYDKNTRLAKVLKKKYNSKKININFSYKEILKKKNFNLVILSSVIQYISPYKLRVLINQLSKNNKRLIFVITDIPYLPRKIEFLLLPFFNVKRFLFILSLVFSNNYRKLNYYLYPKKKFQLLQEYFQCVLYF
tara:strand:- start:5908 stop:6456 length:549 start_codon:yes stop_codon:yes gene_type:complete